MAIKKSQLFTSLKESCNALRSKSSMDSSQYKDYVLIILFVKYLSDKAGQPGFRLRVPEGCSYKDFSLLKQSDNIGEQINIKLEAIKEANNRILGNLALPNFNDPEKLGKGRDMVDALSQLIALFERDELDFSKNRAADDDLLGDAYEYLMKNFAVESGKSKGQFYTPAEVSRVIAKVLHIEELNRAGQSIYDPTCGSGSLLLRALAEASNPRVSLRGQEKDGSTAALAKLNMILHGVANVQIEVANTLTDPRFTVAGNLQTFDICVANPPFSVKNWKASDVAVDPYNRWTSNLMPPAKCGDYAFLLHLIRSMNPDTGRGACILPHGVLFRGNAEYNIRKHIVSQRYIKGIIGMPSNIFFGTPIAAAVVVVDMAGRRQRKGIFFIDAKDGFMKDGAKNRLREQDIRRIVDAWEQGEDIPHFCRMATWQEIEANDFNLNIPRYIAPRDTEVQQDLHAHLHGGLPASDINALGEYWNACPSLKDALLASEGNGYYQLSVGNDNIADVINNNDSYQARVADFDKLLNDWTNLVQPVMKALTKDVKPKKLIAEWSEAMLDMAKAHGGLVSPYDIYDLLMNYWADVMQDDCYMISNDGWTYPEVKAVRLNDKGKQQAVSYADIACDLVPVSLVLDEYFTAETAAIDTLRQQSTEKQSQMDELVEENRDAFCFNDGDEEAETIKVKEADVRKAIKKGGESIKLWKDWLSIMEGKKKLDKERSEKEKQLTSAVVAKYAALTEDEIKTLVVDRKWLATIRRQELDLMQTVTHNLTAELSAIAQRYADTLPSLENSLAEHESKVMDWLKEMGV